MPKAIPNERFGRLLNEGIASVSTRQEKTKAAIEQEIGEQFGRTIHMVQRWQKGHIPTNPEQVAFLVRYCVKRGRVGRDWATGFLAQARYDNREKLLAELFPETESRRTQVNRVYENLPPRYGEFLGRVADINRLLEGLISRWPVISIEGLGGMGKTTLAVEVARRCLAGDSSALDDPFAAIVWVSARDKPEQKKWLNEVLDTIARVLDYPYIAQLTTDEKQVEIDNLLRAQRTLVIVDNYETIEDSALEQWILHVPEPSKVLMTTRYGQLRSAWVIHLNGLERNEALQLIRNHLRRLELWKLDRIKDSEFYPLVDVTDGNPKAIEMALGFVNRGMMSLNEIVEQLHSASKSVNNIFDYLFSRAWDLLSEDAKLVMQTTSLFVGSIDKKALGAVGSLSNYQLSMALVQLNEMSLIEENVSNSEGRIGTHPLSRAYAYLQLSSMASQENELRERWAFWAMDTAKLIYADNRRDTFRSEVDNLVLVLDWLKKKNKMREFTLLFERIQAFLYSDGHWNFIIESASAIAQWAIRTNDLTLMPVVLASSVDALDKLGLHQKASEWLQEIFKNIPAKDELVQAEFWLAEERLRYRMPHSLKLQHFERGKDSLLKALKIFQIHNNFDKTAWTLNTLGHLHRQQLLFEDAVRFYEEGLETVSQHRDSLSYWQGIFQGGIAIVRGRQGHYQESFQLMSETLPLLIDQADQAIAYVVMAYLKLKLNDIRKAESYRQMADNLIVRLGMARPIYWEDEKWDRLYRH